MTQDTQALLDVVEEEIEAHLGTCFVADERHKESGEYRIEVAAIGVGTKGMQESQKNRKSMRDFMKSN